MKAYIAKRLLFLIPLLFIVSFLAFSLVNLTSKDPAGDILRAQGYPAFTEEMVEQVKIEYGLDKPFLVRYFSWLSGAVHLDFGKSYIKGQSVSAMIFTALGYTMQLVGTTLITVMLFALFFGILCTIFEGRALDITVRIVLYIVAAMPAFWIATHAIWFFSNTLHWLPTSGVGSAAHFVMPTLVLSIGYFTFYFRMIRNSMLENVNENYVLFLRSSGVKEKRITLHVLRNSLQTAVAAFCMAIPGMMAGSVIIENVFAWPGIGRVCVSAIFSRDMPVILGYILFMAVLYCCFNIFSDILNAALNPRLRRS